MALGEDANSRSETKGQPAPSEQSAAAQASGADAAALLPPAAITQHSIHLAGVEIPYSAKTAMLSLRDARGKTLADIFYVAYVREPLDPKRPITFVFNGGPGAASAYLHLGAIGPKVVTASAKNCSPPSPARRQ
jgi:carboxypeptidase C (cathepsin A)